MIHEVIVTTTSQSGVTHIAPMGIRERGELVVISPAQPSTTLENLLQTRCAAVNFTDDVRIFAGCLTGRHDWPLFAANRIAAPRLAEALAHREVELVDVEEDATRPKLLCRVLHEETHRPFHGFNRAQAAVLELAILVSRLERLPLQKIVEEMAYLLTAVEKTAGPREQRAWEWLMERITAHPSNAEQGQ
ncbi:tetrahydromethanopterin synthesis protein [Thiocystis violacea]|nr:tetrahydromethanopterin synthesis protein [Thiocystis violacea]